MKTRKKTILICTLIPLLLACLYMFLCTLNLKSSIWFDESYSAYLIRGDFGQIWYETAQDVHPPVFYFLLKIWSLIFDTSDFALRFMSVFFGAICIILAFHLVKRWFNVRTATIATVFLALSPLLIRYGQEMRMYTLVFAIVLGATYALDLALETKKKRYYILYGVLVSLGMWTHYFSALAWIAHVVYLTAVQKINIVRKPFLFVYLGAILLYLPWLPILLVQFTTVQAGFWIPGVTLSTFPDYFAELTVFKDTAEGAEAWLALALIAMLVVLIITTARVLKFSRNKKQRQKLSLLALLAFLPPAILFLLSMPPLSSMFVTRYVVYSACFAWLLFGVLVSLALTPGVLMGPGRARYLPVLAIPLCLGLEIVGIVNVENRQPLGYSKYIIEDIRALSPEGEPTVLKDGGLQEYDFSFYSTAEYPIYMIGDWLDYPWGSTYPLRDYRATTLEHLEDLDSEKFWVVVNTVTDPTEVLDSEKYEIVTTISTEYHQAIEFRQK